MARLIVFSDYLKSSEKGHVLENLNYIATRDGVVKNQKEQLQQLVKPLTPSTAIHPVTDKQYDLIQQLVCGNQKLKETIPYEQYEKQSNMYTASVFIAEASEQLLSQSYENKEYLKYISERPGVEKHQNMNHGLFDTNGAADFQQYYNDLADHKGNVWRHIISLRREDAVTYGFENQNAWRDLINNHINKLAYDIGIDVDHLRWTAAFHDEGYHPHVHLMVWSTNEKEGFQTVDAIENFKKSMVKEIFSDELWLREQFKAEIRDDFEQTFKDEFQKLADQIYQDSKALLPDIAQSLIQLASVLPERKKQNYAYLKLEVKALCNQIVQEILDDPKVQPLLDQYMESHRILASMYMKEDSEAMKQYLQQAVQHLISPSKGDRNVLHNYILKIANDWKQEEAMRQLLCSSVFQSLDEKLQDCKYHMINKDLGHALLKVQMLKEADPMETIKLVQPYFDSREEALETYLDLKDHCDISKKDIMLINQHFHEAVSYNESLQAVSLPIHEAGKIIQHIFMAMGEAKAKIDQEIHRIFIAHRKDEFNMKVQATRK